MPSLICDCCGKCCCEHSYECPLGVCAHISVERQLGVHYWVTHIVCLFVWPHANCYQSSVCELPLHYFPINWWNCLIWALILHFLFFHFSFSYSFLFILFFFYVSALCFYQNSGSSWGWAKWSESDIGVRWIQELYLLLCLLITMTNWALIKWQALC